MGSLNTDGSRIVPDRQSLYKNGRGHKITADRLEVETLAGPSPVTRSDQLGTNADRELTQRSVYQKGHEIQITQSRSDADVEAVSNVHEVVASEQPELAKISETPRGVAHTGNKIVVSDSVASEVVERKADTGVYHRN
jgi:hypothetical protein